MRRQEVVSIIIRVVCCLKGDDVVRYEVHVAVTLTCVEVKPAELEIACELFMFRVEHLLPLFSLCTSGVYRKFGAQYSDFFSRAS